VECELSAPFCTMTSLVRCGWQACDHVRYRVRKGLFSAWRLKTLVLFVCAEPSLPID
jgi:hypothetical protein